MPREEVAYPGNGDLSKRGRWYEKELKVRGWESEERTVQRLLNHLARKTGSESSRRSYLDTLARLCRREGKGPSELARLRKSEAEDAVQSYLDSMLKAGCRRRGSSRPAATLVGSDKEQVPTKRPAVSATWGNISPSRSVLRSFDRRMKP